MVALWQSIEALDNRVGDALQSSMLIDTSRQLERATLMVPALRRLKEDVVSTIDLLQAERRGAVGTAAGAARCRRARARVDTAVAHYVDGGVPRELAQRIVTFDTLNATLDIAEVP